MSVSDRAHKVISQTTNRQWKIDGRSAHPTQDDVNRMIAAMVNDIRMMGYDSIESGGILVKRDGTLVDVYVHVGELNETDYSI